MVIFRIAAVGVIRVVVEPRGSRGGPSAISPADAVAVFVTLASEPRDADARHSRRTPCAAA